MKKTVRAKLLILGSGPAGWTAAVYAARANLNPVLITGVEEGGQLTTTTDVDNWPADCEGVQGPELMERFRKHALRFGVQVVRDNISAANFSARPLRVSGADEYECDALVIATGARAKYLGLPSEEKYKGRGVSACATCDGFFFRGKSVVVVGGGNTAVEEALYLSNIAAKTTLIHRRDQLRAEAILQKRLFEKAAQNGGGEGGGVEVIFNHVVDEALGDGQVANGVKIRNTQTGALSQLSAEGIFIAVGHQPNTEPFAGHLPMENGCIITRGGRNGMATATAVPGVFAAGDAQDAVYRQAVTSAGSGCMAALDAAKYLEENGLV